MWKYFLLKLSFHWITMLKNCSFYMIPILHKVLIVDTKMKGWFLHYIFPTDIFQTRHKNTSNGYLYPHMYSLSDLLRYIGLDFWQRHVINLVNDPKVSLITTLHQSYIRFKSMMIRYNLVWVISVPLKATLIKSWKAPNSESKLLS